MVPIRPPSLRRRRSPRPLDLLFAALVLWLVACGLTLRQARQRADDGLVAVRAAEQKMSVADLLEGRALAPLERAGTSFRAARDRFSHPILAPLTLLPVAGRQVRSARALATAAATASGVAAGAVREAGLALALPRESGPQRVEVLRRLGGLSIRADRALAGLRLGPREALVGPLARARAELAGRVANARRGLGDAGLVATEMADLLAGGDTYLLLAANNAEMRAGSGMFLGVAELRFVAGRMEVGPYRNTGDMVLDPVAAPPVGDADLAARWGWLHPEQEWRNLALSPRFAASAELAARMWQAGGGPPVTGVIALDPLALKALLAAAGPVAVGDSSVSADTVVGTLLHDQYAGLGQESGAEHAARRDQLGLIATAALGTLNSGTPDLSSLADGLAAAGRGRHLLAWSADAGQQRMWTAAGLDGGLSTDSLMVSVLNRGGNKLDQFLDVTSRLRSAASPSAASPSASSDRELMVTLRNRTPDGEAGYVAGPHAGVDVAAGDYIGLVSVNLPAAARQVSVDEKPELMALGPDGPTTVVAWSVRVDKGRSASFTVRFKMATDTVRVEPSARVPPVRWVTPSASFDGDAARVVRLPAGARRASATTRGDP
ncbi:MAG: DUF4012 domain-containing protein [Acidimicrobiales bacterium]